MFPQNAGCEHHGVLESDVLLVRDDDVSCAVGLPTGAVTQYEPGGAYLVVLLHSNAEEDEECFVKLIYRDECWVKKSLPDDHHKPPLLVIASQWKEGPGVENIPDPLLSGVPVIKPLRGEGANCVEEVVLGPEHLRLVVAASVEESEEK